MNERYRLVRPLAAGGMAELFLGVARGAEGFERPVAIKRVLPHLAREPDIARMFLAEARLSTLLQHQNIATVYDVGQGPEGLFLVMELVDGWDLGVLLRTAAHRGLRFPPHLAAFIVHQCLAGLGHAYRKVHDGRPVMVAHRDVSPSNVLVSREGEVKLADFGIAKLAGPAQTEPGVFRGKEAYSAPEVLRGAPATAASDQFSLGIVFYELLTGRHPFRAEERASAVAHAILTRPVTPPPDVPAPLAGAVMRMLATTPGERFPSPEALSDGFARWLAQTGQPATSQALAAFMRELGLPPTLREQAEAAGPASLHETPARVHAGSPRSATDAGGHAKPAGPGVGPPMPAMNPAGNANATPRSMSRTAQGSPLASATEPEEEPLSLPGGAALSISGRMVHHCAGCGQVLPGPNAPCGHCGTRASLAPGSGGRTTALSAASSATRHPVPSPGDELSVQQTLAESVPQSFSAAGVKSVLHTSADALELEERPRPPATDWPDETSGAWRSRVKRMGALLAALALLGGGLWLWPQRSTLLIQVLSATGLRLSAPTLSVESEPSGATVWMGDTALGTTPLRLDNRFPQERVPIQVRLKGYRTWKGTFAGGEAAHLDVKLKRAARSTPQE